MFGQQLDKDIFSGAQVFIEPGQTSEETEQWFKDLCENEKRTMIN